MIKIALDTLYLSRWFKIMVAMKKVVARLMQIKGKGCDDFKK